MIKLTLEVIEEIREARREDPTITPGEIARKIGCTEFQVVRTLNIN